MPSLVLRPAMAADIPALHALIEGAYRGESSRRGWTHEADLLLPPRTSAAELAALLADPNNTMLLAHHDGALAGSVLVSRVSDDRAYLGLLAVDPARQAGGIGRRLVAAAEDHARRRGARTIEMTVVSLRAELIAYYERRGFARTGERRPFPITLDPPLELLVLARPL